MEREPLVAIRGLCVNFRIPKGFWNDYVLKRRKIVHAVDHIDLTVGKGEIVSLVGESGSGKTTTGRAVLQLAPISQDHGL